MSGINRGFEAMLPTRPQEVTKKQVFGYSLSLHIFGKTFRIEVSVT